jgi:hypothetical protein
MKTIFLICTLLLLVSCNDALRNRLGKCRSSTGQPIVCENSNALTTENFRKMYYAQITTSIVVGQSQVILKDYAQNSDFDAEMSCDLEVSANKQFSYAFEKGKLILKDGIVNLRLTRTSGDASDGIVGTWFMSEAVGNVTTETELIFNDLENLRIIKRCNLK